MNQKQTAVIIGAGPAGLTAAFELLRSSSIKPIILEKSEHMGGISRTVRYKGNRMDIGGHRFFSKSDRVMNFWLELMPLEQANGDSQVISYQNRHRSVSGLAGTQAPEDPDNVMLLRPRKSRIYFLRKLFDYPITLSSDTIGKLGLLRTSRIALSYIRALMRRIQPEVNLEHFFINRFGRELYVTFFKSYTEKVWGVPCNQISAEWGAQRIKGLSIKTALLHLLKKAFRPSTDVKQKQVETSLIDRFLYPKYGPGQLWENVARIVQKQGGSILTGWNVETIHVDGKKVTAVEIRNAESGERQMVAGDYFFSTMPVRELIQAIPNGVPGNVREVADGLLYRDFITVGLLLKRLAIDDTKHSGSRLLKDNWIYIQEPDVLVGRMQIFNNWSPHMVADPDLVWIGLEYFCYETDDLWKKSDADMVELAVGEMEKIGIVKKSDVLDATVVRVPKTYPAYFGRYDRFHEIREYVDGIENLFLVGRNGMHRYNNQDHSMLTAMIAVENIVHGVTDKSNIWAVNTEEEYHEEKKPVTANSNAEAVEESTLAGQRT